MGRVLGTIHKTRPAHTCAQRLESFRVFAWWQTCHLPNTRVRNLWRCLAMFRVKVQERLEGVRVPKVFLCRDAGNSGVGV